MKILYGDKLHDKVLRIPGDHSSGITREDTNMPRMYLATASPATFALVATAKNTAANRNRRLGAAPA